MDHVRRMVVTRPLALGQPFSGERLFRLAERAATNAYLDAAQTIGLFKGREGRDLLSRLRGRDMHGHRGAMAECLAAWWLHSVLKLRLTPRPRGLGRKVLEFAIQHRPTIGVEVKAPYRPLRYEPGQAYIKDPRDPDHIGAVVKCLRNANRQFDPDQVNVVVLVPSLDWDVLRAVIRALEEDRTLAIDAVMIIKTMLDVVNPAGRRLGKAFVEHRCSVVRNRHRKSLPDSLWRGWPTYEGPDFEYWKKLAPAYGRRDKAWVRVREVEFSGMVVVPV